MRWKPEPPHPPRTELDALAITYERANALRTRRRRLQATAAAIPIVALLGAVPVLAGGSHSPVNVATNPGNGNLEPSTARPADTGQASRTTTTAIIDRTRVTPTTAAVPPYCTRQDLRVTVTLTKASYAPDDEVDGTVKIVNVSDHTCLTKGIGSIEVRDSNGRVVGDAGVPPPPPVPADCYFFPEPRGTNNCYPPIAAGATRSEYAIVWGRPHSPDRPDRRNHPTGSYTGTVFKNAVDGTLTVTAAFDIRGNAASDTTSTTAGRIVP